MPHFSSLIVSSRSARKLANAHRYVASAILHVSFNLKALSTMEYTDCNRLVLCYTSNLTEYTVEPVNTGCYILVSAVYWFEFNGIMFV